MQINVISINSNCFFIKTKVKYNLPWISFLCLFEYVLQTNKFIAFSEGIYIFLVFLCFHVSVHIITPKPATTTPPRTICMILLLQTSRATNVHSFYRSMTTAWNVRYLIQKGVEKNVKILTIIIPCNLINWYWDEFKSRCF